MKSELEFVITTLLRTDAFEPVPVPGYERSSGDGTVAKNTSKSENA